MGSTYILRKGESELSDLIDGKRASGLSTFEIFYVDPANKTGAKNDAGPGTLEEPFATSQAAIDACTAGRGDIIIRLAGGEEVTSTVAFNKTGISYIAADYGASRHAKGELFSIYSASAFTDGPAATITSRCYIEGIAFASQDTGATFWSGAALLIGGAGTALPFGTHIKNCRFPKWNLANRIGIAIEGSSDTLIEGCGFEGVGSDFDSGIYLQGGAQNITIINNHFRDCTYGLVMGSFAGGGPHLLYGHNVHEDSKVLSGGVASEANPGLVYDNWCEGATDSGSYNDTVDNLNTGGLVFSDQHYAE